jgi:hypothetical protein
VREGTWPACADGVRAVYLWTSYTVSDAVGQSCYGATAHLAHALRGCLCGSALVQLRMEKASVPTLSWCSNNSALWETSLLLPLGSELR